uniref:Uncharacterized protein n=1 Tax=viral metagenome TaxID=1070528 RepID=A0A6C0AGQ6_9ZZZZ
MSTGNGPCQKLLLEFKEPIYIGLEGLDPVPVYYLIVAKEKPKEDELPILIGLDIICQYDISLTALN